MDSFHKCITSMKPTEERGIAIFWENRFRCLVDNTGRNLPVCPDNNIKSRKSDGTPDCACTGSEALDWRPEAKLSYVYDATKMVIEAIRKLVFECGNNCKETIRPGDVLDQLKSMKYDGVTGPIQFEGTERKGMLF
jgi:hypothetical protein